MSKEPYPSIFEQAFEPGFTWTKGEKVFFDRQTAGQLRLESGLLHIVDPVLLEDSQAMLDAFPKGDFPLDIAIARIADDERIAFVRLRFKDDEIAEWNFASFSGQDSTDIRGEELNGFAVDGGIAVLCDQKNLDKLAVGIDDFDWEYVFDDKVQEHFVDTRSHFIHQENGLSMAVFSTGYGDGFYGVYIARNKEGEVLQLLIDCAVVEWWNT